MVQSSTPRILCRLLGVAHIGTDSALVHGTCHGTGAGTLILAKYIDLSTADDVRSKYCKYVDAELLSGNVKQTSVVDVV